MSSPELRPILPPPWPSPIHKAAFHGPAGELVRLVEPHSEADPVAVLVQALAMFGNCMGRTAYFEVEADRHYGNLFLCLVGRTAKGRKGTSLGYPRRVFATADNDWTDSCIKSGLSSGEGLLHAVRDAQGKDEGVREKRLLAVEPEFATLLKHMERQGNILSSQLRQCWDGPAVCQTLTRTNPVKATAAHVSLIAHVTDEELRRYLSATEQASGFGNRFLWLAVKRSKSLPEGGNLDPHALDDVAEKFRNAVTVAREAGTVELDEDARRRWHEVYPRLSESRPGLTGAMLGRAEAQVRRLAMLYALLDQTTVCGLPHLLAALALWAYAARSVQFVFGDGTGDKTADAILDALGADAEKGLTRTAIAALFGNHKPASEIQRAVGVLLAGQLAHGRKIATEGRAEERWFPGPAKEAKEAN